MGVGLNSHRTLSIQFYGSKKYSYFARCIEAKEFTLGSVGYYINYFKNCVLVVLAGCKSRTTHNTHQLDWGWAKVQRGCWLRCVVEQEWAVVGLGLLNQPEEVATAGGPLAVRDHPDRFFQETNIPNSHHCCQIMCTPSKPLPCHQTSLREINKNSINGEVCCVPWLEDSMQERCQFFPNWSKFLLQYLSKSQPGFM